MKKFSRQFLAFQISYLLLPGIPITSQSSITFQEEIRKAGLNFSRLNIQNNALIIERDEPSHIQISVGMVQPQQPFCQLAILANMPQTGIQGFCMDAEAAITAFRTTWSDVPQWQIIKCDASIKELHETESEHAFKELWEDRLGQSSKSLVIFGRPVRGGGIRFVLDPIQSDPDPIQIDI